VETASDAIDPEGLLTFRVAADAVDWSAQNETEVLICGAPIVSPKTGELVAIADFAGVREAACLPSEVKGISSRTLLRRLDRFDAEAAQGMHSEQEEDEEVGEEMMLENDELRSPKEIIRTAIGKASALLQQVQPSMSDEHRKQLVATLADTTNLPSALCVSAVDKVGNGMDIDRVAAELAAAIAMSMSDVLPNAQP